MQAVTQPVKDAMNAANANVLTEDNILQRTCEHGIRHPVCTLDARPLTKEAQYFRHESLGQFGGALRIDCDGCCPNPGEKPEPKK